MDYDDTLEIPPNGTSLTLLQAIYRNSSIPLPVRIRCAVACLDHEHPRLQVTAQVNEQSFAEVLERRLKRLGNPPVMIDAKPIKENGGNADARLPPAIPDRRFRRF
jgi:hypothetical protein